MQSEQEYIRNLVEKFWSAETSPDEEKALIELIESGQITDAYTVAYFKMQNSYRTVTASQQLSNKLDNIGHQKTKITPVFLAQWRNIAAIFISIVIMGIIVSYYQDYRSKQWLYVDTYQSPEQAFKAIKIAIKEFETQMDQGNIIVISGIEQIDDMQHISY
jgi:beta-lactamase regulating signal transducer with metallopeptidase domain